ncbi:MAG: GNAT family N-acetyltransferase [Acidimicrobiales bacterium]|nr:GNAT family N-acetyltransferase [Acidimicrobiales bacterium]
MSVCDSFATFDLGGLGLQRVGTAPWYARPPGRVTVASRPDGIVIRRVANQDELRQFERAILIAFTLPFSVEPFALHSPAILDDPAMHVLAGWCDGHLVSTSMAYEAAGVLGIYGIGTIPKFRGRGFARAMTETALAICPELPVTLQPTQAAAPMYRALGFAPIGTYALWRR